MQPKEENSEKSSEESAKDNDPIVNDDSIVVEDPSAEPPVPPVADGPSSAGKPQLSGGGRGPAAWWKGFRSWMEDARHKALFFSGLAVFVLLLLAIPPVRYGLFNSVGIRVNCQVVVLDQDSGQPLKGASVHVGNVTAVTDKEGLAKLGGLRLGRQVMTIEKLAYSDHEEKVTLGLGDNDLKDVDLQPTGAQYSFVIVDWLSKAPIEDAEVVFGPSSAVSDEAGVALITIPPTEMASLTLTVTAAGYRSEDIQINAATDQQTTVDMVLTQPHYFISKRSGRYDLYRIDLDGKNEQLVLAGTGKEVSYGVQLVAGADQSTVYLVSSREGRQNGEGSMLYGLYKVSASGRYTKLDESEEIRLYGWAKERLIYLKIAAGTSAGNPQRQRLISLNPQTDAVIQLGASNYFTSVVLTDEAVYYATNDYYSTDNESRLVRANPVGGQNSTIYTGEVWTILRSNFSELTFNVNADWYKVSTVAGAVPVGASGQPTDYLSRGYVTSPDSGTSLWVDHRDGQAHLLALDIDSAAEELIIKQSYLGYPIDWIDDNHIVFRVASPSETADYVMDLTTRIPHKLADVTDASVFVGWY